MYKKTVQERTAHLQAQTYGVQLGSVREPVGVQDSLVGVGVLFTSSLKCQLPLHKGVKQALWAQLGQYVHDIDATSPVDIDDCEVKLYTGLAVSAEGSTQRIMYHANPSLKGHPWYDDVLLLDDIDEEGVPILHAGRLRAIVSVMLPSATRTSAGGEHIVLVFVHAFCGARHKTSKQGRSRPTTIASLEPSKNHHSAVPFPYMQFLYDKNGAPVYWLLESESVSSGVWVQEDFDSSGKYFFIQ